MPDPTDSARHELVGQVSALWRYPVKSMSGDTLQHADIGWQGLAGDRRWAFLRPDRVNSGFPWLTIREQPEMWRYRPFYREPDRPEGSPVTVVTPSGRELSVADPKLARELGDDVQVMKQSRGVFDTMALSLITRQSLTSLAGLLDSEPDVRRFRPNLCIDATGPAPFPEDEWVGRTLRIGTARLRIDQRDSRCVLVNVDPLTGSRDPAILRVIARERQACLGVSGTTVTCGSVAVGDPVLLES